MFNPNDLYIDSNTSKSVLEAIIKSQKINFKKLKILHLKKKILSLQKKFNKKRDLLENSKKYNLRKFIFWKIAEENLRGLKFTIKSREKQKKENYLNIHFSELGKSIGYNPSLLTILIYTNEIKKLLRANEFFNKLQKSSNLENIGMVRRLEFINLIKAKKKINIITPLCPDYEHVKVASGLYKYTFNKLNEGYGLIGKRLLNIIDNLHGVLRKNKVKFKHHILYGDFEAFNVTNCNRLKIKEEEFIKKLNLSSLKMTKKLKEKKTPKQFYEVNLLTKKYSNKKEWLRLCQKNFKIIKKKYKSDNKFRNQLSEIVSSRIHLYNSWFPGMKKDKYTQILLEQGAEYTSMGDIFAKNLDNPVIIGLDHPKMKQFYNLNNPVCVIYGLKNYI